MTFYELVGVMKRSDPETDGQDQARGARGGSKQVTGCSHILTLAAHCPNIWPKNYGLCKTGYVLAEDV